MMRFPSFETGIAPLTTTEVEALRSLSIAAAEMRREWQLAGALWDRIAEGEESAGGYTQGLVFRDQLEAYRQAAYAASDYERRMAAITWRYVSALAVLSGTLLERVVTDRPPLTDEMVKRLTGEPTLGQLRAVFAIPASSLLIARPPDWRSHHQETRQHILDLLDHGAENIQELSEPPLAQEDLDSCQLTVVQEEGADSLFAPLIEPVYGVAGQAPNEIGYYLKQSR